MKRELNNYFILIFLSIFFFGCSTDRPTGKTEAEVLFQEAKELREDGRYLMALEKLNLIRSQYPYSYYSTHAELMSADVYFEQENYAEAAAAYIVFKDFHPKYKNIPYVIWKIAESFYNQLPSTFDRDLSAGNEAIKYYQQIIRDYPTSNFVSAAKEKIIKCKELVRNKEKYIADFYFKTEDYLSARFHYITITEKFLDKSVLGHAMVRILEASAELKEKDSCTHYYHHYQRVVPKNYKKSFENAYDDCKEIVINDYQG
jgi:outer membrane protein assembly factor BamD